MSTNVYFTLHRESPENPPFFMSAVAVDSQCPFGVNGRDFSEILHSVRFEPGAYPVSHFILNSYPDGYSAAWVQDFVFALSPFQVSAWEGLESICGALENIVIVWYAD